jgi:hypothetical protein
MDDIGAIRYAAKDRSQARIEEHLLCEDNNGVMHTVF